MEQLKTLDLICIEIEENIEHVQTMRKRRQDKTLMEGKRCEHCKKPSYDIMEKNEKTHQAMEKLKGNKISKFHKGQKILWDQRMNKPGTCKFRIQWSGPYEIMEIYDNNTVDVSTLQGETLGRVNMSKIKPYHEPFKAKAYALEVGDTTNSSIGKTIQSCTNKFCNTNHHNGNSRCSYNQRKPCEFLEGQKVVCKYLPYKQIKTTSEQQQ
jgi:hypothetical protein